MENKYQLSRLETARAARTPNINIYGPSATGGIIRSQDALKEEEIKKRREGLAAMSPEQRIGLAQKEKQSVIERRETGPFSSKYNYQQGATNYMEPSSGSVQGSFNRMMGIGQIGGLGGRMGELEKASMRLGEAASQRRIAEMEKEQQVKTAGIGQTARASEKADLESRLRQLQSKRPNLMFNQEGQDWQNEIRRLENQIKALG